MPIEGLEYGIQRKARTAKRGFGVISRNAATMPMLRPPLPSPTIVQPAPAPIPAPMPAVQVGTTASGTPVMVTTPTAPPPGAAVVQPATMPALTPEPMPDLTVAPAPTPTSTQAVQVSTTPSGTPVMVSPSIPKVIQPATMPAPTRAGEVGTTPSGTPVMIKKMPAETPAPILQKAKTYQFFGFDITNLVIGWNDLVDKLGLKSEKVPLSLAYKTNQWDGLGRAKSPGRGAYQSAIHSQRPDGTLRELERE